MGEGERKSAKRTWRRACGRGRRKVFDRERAAEVIPRWVFLRRLAPRCRWVRVSNHAEGRTASVSGRVRAATAVNRPYLLMRCHFATFSCEMNHSSFRSMRFHPSPKQSAPHIDAYTHIYMGATLTVLLDVSHRGVTAVEDLRAHRLLLGVWLAQELGPAVLAEDDLEVREGRHDLDDHHAGGLFGRWGCQRS